MSGGDSAFSRHGSLTGSVPRGALVTCDPGLSVLIDARIRLGDIEIDDNVVRIGGVPQVPVPHAPPHALIVQTSSLDTSAPPPDVPSLPSLKGLPVSGRFLLRAGAVVLLGTLAVLAVFPPASFLSLLLHVLPLPFGAGLLALGALKRAEERRELRAARLRDEAELAPHLDRVRGALSEPKPEQTIEWLAARLRLPEATVVRVLDRLRKQGEIEEELNTDSGEWYYFTRRALGAGHSDLDARMAALNKRRTE